jgi:hypothetical protein
MRGGRRAAIGAAGLTVAAVLAVLAALWPSLRHGEGTAPAQAAETGPLALAVRDIQLGRAVGLDKRIADPAEAFAPEETIYASVVTEGTAAEARLTARFAHQGQVLAEVSQLIAPTGTAVSEFNVWKPRGWPRGDYEVGILVNGTPAGARRFVVR